MTVLRVLRVVASPGVAVLRVLRVAAYFQAETQQKHTFFPVLRVAVPPKRPLQISKTVTRSHIAAV